MALTLWTSGGILLASGGNLIVCEECPCVGEQDHHLSPCNGDDPVPGTLELTINFDGNTLSVPLTWLEDQAECGSDEGWGYTSALEDGDEICAGLTLLGAALCCNGATWGMQLAMINNTVLTSYATPPNGADFAPFTVVDTDPFTLSTDTNGADIFACGVLAPMTIDIAPPP